MHASTNNYLVANGAPFKIKRPPFFNYVRNLGVFAWVRKLKTGPAADLRTCVRFQPTNVPGSAGRAFRKDGRTFSESSIQFCMFRRIYVIGLQAISQDFARHLASTFSKHAYKYEDDSLCFYFVFFIGKSIKKSRYYMCFAIKAKMSISSPNFAIYPLYFMIFSY